MPLPSLTGPANRRWFSFSRPLRAANRYFALVLAQVFWRCIAIT
jgi:hypothetical protein